MNSRNTIQDELNGMNSGLPSNTGGTPLSVPEGYFEGLAASILAKVKGEENQTASKEITDLSPLLAGISRQMPYSVPDQYFQSTLEVLPVLISEEKESLVLSFIEKEMPYEVPGGYFEKLPAEVLAKLPRQKAKVFPIVRRKWMHVAAAAIVAGIITLSGIVYYTDKPANDASAPIAQQLKNVSTSELDAFIKSTSATLSPDATTQTTAEVKPLLQDVSTNELEAFLDQVPAEDEEPLIN